MRAVRCLLPLLAGTNLIYHFPPLFVMMGNLATWDSFAGIMGSGDFLKMYVEPNVLSRVLHFVLASFAVLGVTLIGYALRVGRKEKDEKAMNLIATWGGRIALVPTLLQLVVGVWVMLTLPAGAVKLLMGKDIAGTLMFCHRRVSTRWASK